MQAQTETEKKTADKKTPLKLRLMRALRSPLSLIALVLLGYGLLALSYMQADRKAADLRFKVDGSRAALRRAAPEVDPIELELADAESALAALKSSRVTTIPEEILVQQTLAAAADTGVVVTSAGTRADTFVQKGGEKVRATPFFVRATGTLDQIEAFLAAMELGQVETLELQSALVVAEGASRALTLAAVIYSHLPLEEAATGEASGTPAAAPQTQAVK